MAIPKINEQSIKDAIKYIDDNGIPDKNKSTQYELVMDDGKTYPPKYVIAVADHLLNGTEIQTNGYNAVEAKNYFETRGFKIETKQLKYELTITSEKVSSTDERFTIEALGLGDGYKSLDAYFIKADGNTIRRKYNKGERRNTNQTMPRLACQIYENQIASLSDWDKERFPVCQYTPNDEVICGIYPTVEEFKKHRNTIEYLMYTRENGPQFVIYCWNIFSTIKFVQECLKRFGEHGDQFILSYRDKTEQEKNQNSTDTAVVEELVQQFNGYRNPYSDMLVESKNIIFRGAPGTGKSYLAKEIAADIISNGFTDDYTELTDEQKKQMEFVQFHPSYDYSDFVEGLRPKMNADGSMGFELQDGVFTKFILKAKKNYEDSQKSKEMIEQELSAQEAITDFFSNLDFGLEQFKTINGNEFYIMSVDDKHISVSIPGNETVKNLNLNIEELQKMVESGEEFGTITEVTKFFGKQYASQGYSYDYAIYKAIREKMKVSSKQNVKLEELKKYIFIIDEINRGEISKILGELFFSIDPGYRGRAGEVATQYSNMHVNPDEKFYIPENVYIIGTMNDIDRSVDSFDFAMRRRFRFVEIKADDRLEMLDLLADEELKNEAIKRMSNLNKEISAVEDLNDNYQIGASYFLKLNKLNFDELWTDYLEPLLQEYIRGMYDEEGIMKKFARAYGYSTITEGDADETTQG